MWSMGDKEETNSELTFFHLIGGPQPLSHDPYSFICHYLGVPEETTDITAAIQEHKTMNLSSFQGRLRSYINTLILPLL